MNRKRFLVGLLAASCVVATSTLMTSPGNAQADPKVAKAMAILKAETAKLGAPKAEGTDQTADKTTPGLYFGSTKVNNDFTIVDKVKAEASGTATLFVKSGDDYVRVSTNVPGSVQGRALGTILDPKCPSEDFLIPLNHLDSMEPILIRGGAYIVDGQEPGEVRPRLLEISERPD